MTYVYKIAPRSDWIAAQDRGCFAGSGVDLADGYIHLSTAEQAAATARLHFKGRQGLVLLKFRAQDLGVQLRWEPSRDGQLFPHLYGELNPSMIVSAQPLELNAEGWPDPGRLDA